MTADETQKSSDGADQAIYNGFEGRTDGLTYTGTADDPQFCEYGAIF